MKNGAEATITSQKSLFCSIKRLQEFDWMDSISDTVCLTLHLYLSFSFSLYRPISSCISLCLCFSVYSLLIISLRLSHFLTLSFSFFLCLSLPSLFLSFPIFLLLSLNLSIYWASHSQKSASSWFDVLIQRKQLELKSRRTHCHQFFTWSVKRHGRKDEVKR